MLTNEEILEKAKRFLQGTDNSSHKGIVECYNEKLAYEGDFWTADRRRDFGVGRSERMVHRNYLTRFVNGGVKRMTNKPWHIQLDDSALKDEQQVVNDFESSADSKFGQENASKDAFICGMGFVHVTSNDDGVRFEHVKNLTKVFVDSFSTECDASDAREVAIVNFISKANAMEKYGVDRDVINPNTSNNPSSDKYVSEISYYFKDEAGKVVSCKICGDYVSAQTLELTRIPLVRFAGYDCGESYVGMMQKTVTEQAMGDMNYTKVFNRIHRHRDVQAVVNGTALKKDEMMQASVKDFKDGRTDVVVSPDVGDVQFTSNELHIEDLALVSKNVEENIAWALGMSIDNDGIDTATEAMLQEQDTNGSIHEIWNHCSQASRTLARITMQILFGQEYPFKLLNGPESITEDLNTNKKREELKEMALLSNGNQQVMDLISYRFAQTLGDDELAMAVKAVIPPDNPIHNELDISSILAEKKQTEDVMAMAGEQLDQYKAMEQDFNALKQEKVTMVQQFQLQKQQMDLDAQKTLMKAEQDNYKLQMQIAELNAKIAKMEAETASISADTEAKQLQNASAKAELITQAVGD